MERSKYLIIVFLLVCCGFAARASYKQEVYTAYITNKMDIWKKVLVQMDAVSTKTNAFRFEWLNYQYGYIAWCIDMNKKDEARAILQQAELNLAILEKEKNNLSMVNAYKAAFYGYKIGLNKLMATTYGPKSVAAAKLALSLNTDNAFAYCQYANIQYYMPAVFGGSKAEALKYYLKCKALMELNASALRFDWNYLNVLTAIAECFYNLKNKEMAKIYCEKILKIEPQFLWIKTVLYPKVMNN